jgi:molybdopterin/thiamine biosynthesis adenylyltransferase
VALARSVDAAETLARMGFARLTVIDRDRVATRNLSTQPYAQGEVGAPKARALANSLYRAVGARLTPVVAELTAANAGDLLAGAALIVDAFDNRAGRAAVSATINRLGLACLHIGFSPDGLYGSGLWGRAIRFTARHRRRSCDYPARPLARLRRRWPPEPSSTIS